MNLRAVETFYQFVGKFSPARKRAHSGASKCKYIRAGSGKQGHDDGESKARYPRDISSLIRTIF